MLKLPMKLCFWFRLIAMNFSAIKRCLRPLTKRYFSSSAANAVQQLKLVNLTVDDSTGIATLELNRPPVNTLNTPLLQDISSALTQVEKNQSKGLILTSVCIDFSNFFLFIRIQRTDSKHHFFSFLRLNEKKTSHRQRYFRPAWIFWKCINRIQKMQESFGLQCKMYGWNYMALRIQRQQLLMWVSVRKSLFNSFFW